VQGSERAIYDLSRCLLRWQHREDSWSDDAGEKDNAAQPDDQRKYEKKPNERAHRYDGTETLSTMSATMRSACSDVLRVEL